MNAIKIDGKWHKVTIGWNRGLDNRYINLGWRVQIPSLGQDLTFADTKAKAMRIRSRWVAQNKIDGKPSKGSK